MSSQHFLAEIKQIWTHRVAQVMARGAGVRESFIEQLNTNRNRHASKIFPPRAPVHTGRNSEVATPDECGVRRLGHLL